MLHFDDRDSLFLQVSTCTKCTSSHEYHVGPQHLVHSIQRAWPVASSMLLLASCRSRA